jgi:hypothetical protein
MRENPEKVFEGLLRKYLKENLKTGQVATQCPDENTVSAYLEDRLTQNLRNDFERHASLCARCQNELGFLLKTEEPAVTTISTGALAKEEFEGGGWLKMIQPGFTWLSNLTLKPVLAILTVTLISGYVGFELFQRQSQRREPALEMAQSPPQDSSRAEEEHRATQKLEKGAAENKPVTAEAVSEAVSQQRYRQMAQHDSATKVLGGGKQIAAPGATISKDANREDSLRDAFSPAASEPSEGDKGLQTAQSSDRLTRRQAMAGPSRSAAPPPASPEAAQQKTDLTNTPESQPTNDKRNAVPANQPALTGAQHAADDEKTIFAANESSREKAKVHNLTASAVVTSGKPKQEAAARSRPDGAGGRRQPQLRLGGKVFELRNNVWKDLSISENDEHAEVVVIYKNSSEYEEQIKPLSAYHAVLARNEDCQIEFQGKVYYVKGPTQ